MNLNNLAGLDFETYCELSLPEVGLARYVNHKTFEITLASIATGNGTRTIEFPGELGSYLHQQLQGYTISAHNAGFERAVLATMGIDIPVIDSAVVAAVAGADRHLAGAAQQLMQTDKLDEDRSLLRLFALPQKDQVSPEFDRNLVFAHWDQWRRFKEYCERDAELSRGIVLDWAGNMALFEREMRFAQITLEMNERGWPVDMDSVHEMHSKYITNLDWIQDDFAVRVDKDLNIGSHAQVKKWCADRGVRSNSFDKHHVEMLITRLRKQMSKGPLSPELQQVWDLLLVKQALGGSSLTKLKTIMNTVHEGRVYDQYVHTGAPQSLRTSGRSIQMQNLPRLAHQRYMGDLHNGMSWTNEELAGNLRQVFTASDKNGELIVADFASIESRALAYMAGEDWKVAAYSRNEDVYKAQAMKIFRIHNVDDVTKEQRTTGKVGELSCGYGAGPVAVKDFAAKMNVEMTESQAGTLVRDWRDANPKTVEFWNMLGEALLFTVQNSKVSTVVAAHGLTIQFTPGGTPASLLEQAPDVKSVHMEVWRSGHKLLSRVFHGCYLAGRDIRYYKPSTLKGGRPWKAKYVDPKTKRQVFYKLYGGKLAGILTQSLCREIFFEALVMIDDEIKMSGCDNVALIGQFHDEVVLDWKPGTMPLIRAMEMLRNLMSYSPTHPQLPMGVEVKHDYRYTK